MQLENLPAMVGGVWSQDNNLQLEATMQFRKLLSIGDYQFISSPWYYSFEFITASEL